MVDLTEYVPKELPLIEGYGPAGFRVGERLYEGAILIARNGVWPWPVSALGEATPKSLEPLFGHDPELELVIIGCGDQLRPPPRDLRVALRERGVGLEPMDTGAACRTYNLLVMEERKVAGALLLSTATG